MLKPKDAAVKPAYQRTLPVWSVTARGLLGTFADVIAVVTAVATVVSFVVKGPPPQTVLAACLGALALAFMGLSFHLQRQQAAEIATQRNRARHAESLDYMDQSSAALRDAIAVLEGGADPAAFDLPASNAVARLAEAMSLASGVPCRVVVKVMYAPEDQDDFAVRTFASSDVSGAKRASGATIDWIRENTDFDEILYKDRDYFLSNNLKADVTSGYKNSHFTRDALEHGYPYLSTIVWPIFGYADDQKANVTGFLCVDSKMSGVFDPERDVVVGKAMASFWYLALEQYRKSAESVP